MSTPRQYTALAQALGFSDRCLTVRVPSIFEGTERTVGAVVDALGFEPPAPGWLPDFVSDSVGWWAGELASAFREPAGIAERWNTRVGTGVRDALGLEVEDAFDFGPPRPPAAASYAADDYLVRIPAWQDVVQIGGRSYFDASSQQQQWLDYQEALERSPVPPSVRELGEILTTLDDIQDETATLAAALMLIEKAAGRAIPGVGWVVGAADGLNALQAVIGRAAVAPAATGRGGKRAIESRAAHSGQGYTQRLEELRRSGRLGLGVGDALQALQATDSLTGYGIQIGGLFGALIDGLFGAVQGAEFRFPGPWNDPFNFDQQPCSRSPGLASFGPATARVLRLQALRLWSQAARVSPWLGELPESALASTLVGTRLAVDVLFEWGLAGEWLDYLPRVADLVGVVAGGSSAHGLRDRPVDEWIRESGPVATGSIRRAIANVRDRDRQIFYDGMLASTGWKIAAFVDPESLVRDQHLAPAWADAMKVIDAGLYPAFDLE